MKKIFTTITMALCLMAFSFSASAQTQQVSAAQKKEIQEKVLPVVFEQIKQKTGIDILGWAQPQLTSDFVESLPGFNAQSGLRSTEKTPYHVKPDSISINVTALAPDFAQLMPAVKISFDNYQEVDFPFEIGNRPTKIAMPYLIKVTSNSPILPNVAEIKIISKTDTKQNLMAFDMTISMLGEEKVYPLLGFIFSQNQETYALEANLKIGEGLRKIWELIGAMAKLPALPELDYVVSIDIAGMMMTGELPLSLYGIPEVAPAEAAAPTQRIPMGDAHVALDFSGAMPVKYIGITSYKDAQASAWSKLWFDMKQANEQDLVLTIDNYKFKDETKADSTFDKSIILTMSDYTKGLKATNPEAAAQSVVNRVVSLLADNAEVAPYQLSIEVAMDEAKTMKAKVIDIDVKPSLTADEAAATINILSYNADGTVKSEMNVIATADLKKDLIRVDVIQGSDVQVAPVASAYFASNIGGVITSNDAILVEELKVNFVDGGMYIANSGKADYRIVGMNGAMVASGRLLGDNAYVSTASLTKGIYVLVVTENGVSRSIKFIR